MTGAMLDLEEVRHALTARRVLDYYQLPTRRSGRAELESSACPRRADHTRRAFTINLQTGQWMCWPCDIGGDPLRLVAEFEHLSDRDDFPTVLARAAEIAGVVASDVPEAERARRAEQWRRERLARAAAERAVRAELERTAVPRATRYWESLPRCHDRGIQYLAERGLAASVPLIRFDAGSPALPLFTRAGEIRNVVRRRLPELGEPKVTGLKGCPTAGTLLGAVTAIAADRPAVIVEGVADALTAAIAWPQAAVLGAHGACNLPAVVRVAAPIVVRQRTRLVLVPHNDRIGHGAAREAGQLAIEAGLSVRAGTLAIVRHGEKDLNDAWRRGWRPPA